MDDGIRRNKRRTSGMVPEVLLRGMVGIKGVIIFEGGDRAVLPARHEYEKAFFASITLSSNLVIV